MELSGANLLWFFAFIFLLGNGGFGNFFGNNRVPMGPPPVTQQDLNAGLNNQQIQSELNSLGLATANNNYETARLIQDQTMAMQNANNTNLINMIQGFNQNMFQIQNQTNILGSKMDALSAQMASCCCEIKTQMLQDRLADKTAEALALQNKLDNRDQTQTILNNLGRFVAWAGSGSQAAAATAG